MINKPGDIMEKTFAIIKPMAVAENNSGTIIDMIESAGFDITCMKKITMTQQQAEELYTEHKEKPFFGEMVETMTSSPVVVMTLTKENAVKAWRDLMGATDPAQAEEGTIRARFGRNISNNAVHGSDALQSSERERGIFFKTC